jgi:hypothetical protein
VVGRGRAAVRDADISQDPFDSPVLRNFAERQLTATVIVPAGQAVITTAVMSEDKFLSICSFISA